MSRSSRRHATPRTGSRLFYGWLGCEGNRYESRVGNTIARIDCDSDIDIDCDCDCDCDIDWDFDLPTRRTAFDFEHHGPFVVAFQSGACEAAPSFLIRRAARPADRFPNLNK
jgi:hypothetical protein